MESLKRHYGILGTFLFDLFLLWVILRFNLGGWERAIQLYSHGLTVWGGVIIGIAFLIVYKSDFRTDIPLFLSAFVLGYWGEWWGTTRGVWTYVTKETPPINVIFFWGVCLLAVYHLHLVFRGNREKMVDKRAAKIMMVTLFVLPLIGLALTWKGIVRVDWFKVVDVHPIAATLLCLVLILRDFELRETFWIFVCGTFIGGFLEHYSTAAGGYRYITGEGIPLLIAPLWGIACVAMVKLGVLIRSGFLRSFSLLKRLETFR